MRNVIATMGGYEQGWTRHNREGNHRDYQKEAERLLASATKFGLECYIYNNEYIKSCSHYKNNEFLLDQVSFGFAYKAICLYDTLQMIDAGDVVLLVDSNHVIAEYPNLFIDIARANDICTRDHIWTYYPNKNWTRRDTFINMNCDTERYWNAPQMQGNLIGAMKSEFSLRFVREFLDYSLNYDVMFGRDVHPNFPEYIDHRHDQSILSILREKYGIPYFNRTANVGAEYIIPELEIIQPQTIIDNSHLRDIRI